MKGASMPKKEAVPVFVRTINIRVSTELDDEVRRFCEAYDLSISSFCRFAIDHFLYAVERKAHLYV
jgi:hypothetical protein